MPTIETRKKGRTAGVKTIQEDDGEERFNLLSQKKTWPEKKKKKQSPTGPTPAATKGQKFALAGEGISTGEQTTPKRRKKRGLRKERRRAGARGESFRRPSRPVTIKLGRRRAVEGRKKCRVVRETFLPSSPLEGMGKHAVGGTLLGIEE